MASISVIQDKAISAEPKVNKVTLKKLTIP